MAEDNNPPQQDRWRELADLLGLPPEDPACPRPEKKPEPPPRAVAVPAPPAPPPAEELIEEAEHPHPAPATETLHEGEPEPETMAPQGAVAEELAPPRMEDEERPRGRRGRGRRGRGRRGDDESRGRHGGRHREAPPLHEEEETAPEPIAEDEELPPPPSPEDEEPEEELDLTNWNVPSWSELIASLYRPDR